MLGFENKFLLSKKFDLKKEKLEKFYFWRLRVLREERKASFVKKIAVTKSILSRGETCQPMPCLAVHSYHAWIYIRLNDRSSDPSGFAFLVDVLVVVFELTEQLLLVSRVRNRSGVPFIVLVVIVFLAVVFVVIRTI